MAPQPQVPVQAPLMAFNDPEQFVPLSDFISLSDEVVAEEMLDEFEHGAEYDDYSTYSGEEDYHPVVLKAKQKTSDDDDDLGDSEGQ